VGHDADALLAPFHAAPRQAGVLVDFDGTLSPIVLDPALAVPLPGASATLLELHAAYAVVAVVSGRPASFLMQRIPEGPRLCGLYGLEQVVDGVVVAHPGASDWRSVIDEVAEVADLDGPEGIDVEHKGLSLTLHFRRLPGVAEAARSWADGVAISTGLHVRPAKMSVELHPPVAVDKGTVVVDLARGLGAVCFVGDDSGDLPAFDALDRLAAEGCTTLRVAVRTSESASELVERADLCVDGPDGALELLRALVPA
jgi:trehalose 6-phosphate phosphatase